MADMKSDPRDCAICFQRFNYDDRQPRMFISCGHSACSSCINQMIINGKIRCPYCRAKCDITNVRQLPVNFGMLQLVDCPQSSEGSPASINIPWVLSPKINAGLCEEHGQYKLFECTTCDQYICHVCTVVEHKKSCKIICIKKAIEIMKDSKVKEFNSVLTSYKEMTQHLENYKELLDKQISGHLNHIIKLEKIVEDHSDLVKKLQNECTKVKEALEESGEMQSLLKTSKDAVTALCGFHEVKDSIIKEDSHLKSAQASRLKCIEEFRNRDIFSSSLKVSASTMKYSVYQPKESDSFFRLLRYFVRTH
nr:E3 ubiquitin-protein ligase TRIM7-like [Cherax quadricarinatus]